MQFFLHAPTSRLRESDFSMRIIYGLSVFEQSCGEEGRAAEQCLVGCLRVKPTAFFSSMLDIVILTFK